MSITLQVLEYHSNRRYTLFATVLIMAEPIAVLSFIAAIAGLIDVGCKVVERLNDFQLKVQHIPETLEQIKTLLPIALDSLEGPEPELKKVP